MTSSNPNDESVDLSMISSNMLEGMKVSETVTPDMSAEVIGGVVDLELREARVKEPGVPEFNFLVQGGIMAFRMPTINTIITNMSQAWNTGYLTVSSVFSPSLILSVKIFLLTNLEQLIDNT